MHRMLRVVSIAIAAAVLLSACGGPAATQVPKPTSAQPTPVETAAKHDPVTLTYWTAGPAAPLDPTTRSMVDLFMKKYPWITVKYEAFPYSEYFQKVDTAFAGGTGPDVLWVDNQQIPHYGYYGTVLPLDNYLPANFTDDYFPMAKQDMYYKGHIYGIPMHQSTEALLYNKDIVEAAGVKPPQSYKEGWTFEQFRSALEKVVKKDANGKVAIWAISSNYGLTSCYSAQPFMYAMGATFMDPQMTTYLGYLNGDKSVAAYQWLGKLVWDGLEPIDKIPDIFQTGRVAFYLANPFVVKDIQNRFPDFKLGVAPLPCAERCAVQSGGYHIGISAQSKHPDEAWLLVDFMTNPQGHRMWLEGTGYLPARKSVYDAMPMLKEFPMAVFMEGLANYAIRRPINEAWPVFDQEFTAATKNLWTGADAKAELDRVANKVEAELKKYRK